MHNNYFNTFNNDMNETASAYDLKKKNRDTSFGPVPDALRKREEMFSKAAQEQGINRKGFHPNALVKDYKDLGNNLYSYILDWNGEGTDAIKQFYDGNTGCSYDLDNKYSRMNIPSEYKKILGINDDILE